MTTNLTGITLETKEMRNSRPIQSIAYETGSYTCDACGKVHTGCVIPADWVEMNAKKSDGYDYFYSEEYHFCSPACLFKMLPSISETFYDGNGLKSDINGMSPCFVKSLVKYAKKK